MKCCSAPKWNEMMNLENFMLNEISKLHKKTNIV